MSGYFLYHSIGTFPGKSRAMSEALANFSVVWSAEDDGQWPAALAARQTFIEHWERCISAPRGTLTTAENVTSALYSLIGSLPPSYLKGRRILVAADCFPSLHFLLTKLASRFDFKLDTVPLRPGEAYVRDEDFIERWDESVGVALLTWVTSTTSHQCDAAALAQHGRQMGSLVGVDITQGVGIAPFKVSDDISFVVSSSLKWLCGTSGAGVIYVNPTILPDCEPEFRGWFSQSNPFSWDLDSFEYALDARRFDHGTPAVLASVASLPGLQFVERTGIDALRSHNLKLVRRIIDHAQTSGWTIVSPLDDTRRGGSLMIRMGDNIDVQSIIAQLRDRKLFCDTRGQIIRLSPGMVTTETDVDLVCQGIKELAV
jgi:selenocysteine lyase/cysteine desulfurase